LGGFFIANPDLAQRIAIHWPLIALDPVTLYGAAEEVLSTTRCRQADVFAS